MIIYYNNDIDDRWKTVENILKSESRILKILLDYWCINSDQEGFSISYLLYKIDTREQGNIPEQCCYLTGGSIKKYNFSLNDKNNKIITLIDTGGDNVDKEFKNFMKFDVYIQKLLKSKKELKNKPDSNMPSF